MPTRKPAPPKKASGENIQNWQRKTAQVLLRLDPDIAKLLRAQAAAADLSLVDYVSRLVREAHLTAGRPRG